MSIYEGIDENYVIYTELESGGRFLLKLLCVNPSVNLQKYLEQGNSTIFFSATFLPIHYYKKLLSTKTDDYAIYAESVFPEKNRLLLFGRDVSTKYTMRTADMYERFAKYILQMALGKEGNYMAFFPSYRLMESVYQSFQKQVEQSQNETIECVLQSQFMGEEAREIFLENFEEEREGTLVGFCVMGGIFSEGIDLTADKLIGAAIVGTGIPQVCTERELIRQYFEKDGMSGFDFAYLYPGMNKVLQSAGRVIRTEEDKGVLLLLDDRFFGRQYREIFPREWSKYQVCNLDEVAEATEKFWKGQ